MNNPNRHLNLIFPNVKTPRRAAIILTNKCMNSHQIQKSISPLKMTKKKQRRHSRLQQISTSTPPTQNIDMNVPTVNEPTSLKRLSSGPYPSPKRPSSNSDDSSSYKRFVTSTPNTSKFSISFNCQTSDSVIDEVLPCSSSDATESNVVNRKLTTVQVPQVTELPPQRLVSNVPWNPNIVISVDCKRPSTPPALPEISNITVDSTNLKEVEVIDLCTTSESTNVRETSFIPLLVVNDSSTSELISYTQFMADSSEEIIEVISSDPTNSIGSSKIPDSSSDSKSETSEMAKCVHGKAEISDDPGCGKLDKNEIGSSNSMKEKSYTSDSMSNRNTVWNKRLKIKRGKLHSSNPVGLPQVCSTTTFNSTITIDSSLSEISDRPASPDVEIINEISGPSRKEIAHKIIDEIPGPSKQGKALKIINEIHEPSKTRQSVEIINDIIRSSKREKSLEIIFEIPAPLKKSIDNISFDNTEAVQPFTYKQNQKTKPDKIIFNKRLVTNSGQDNVVENIQRSEPLVMCRPVASENPLESVNNLPQWRKAIDSISFTNTERFPTNQAVKPPTQQIKPHEIIFKRLVTNCGHDNIVENAQRSEPLITCRPVQNDTSLEIIDEIAAPPRKPRISFTNTKHIQPSPYKQNCKVVETNIQENKINFRKHLFINNVQKKAGKNNQRSEPLASYQQKETAVSDNQKWASTLAMQKQQHEDVTLPRSLRPIIIDGCNIGYNHARNKHFSWKGVKIAVDYFTKLGHEVIAYLPHKHWYRQLTDYEDSGQVVYIPSRTVNHKLIAPHDDRYIVKCAMLKEGVILSNDQYRDLMAKDDELKKTIEERLLQFSFAGDLLMVADDPMGKEGPSLKEFLSKPADTSQQ